MQQIGRFRVLEELGRGGEGVVYSAIDPVIGRSVAIKALLAGPGADFQRLRSSLRDEARKSGRLSHPNIVTIHELIEEDNAAYLIMELVDGKSLARLMADGVHYSDETIVRFLHQAADALDYAHSEGLIHRDIKPANLMITSRNQLKVADFGIAKALNEPALSKTETGFVRGTVHYLSPEQIQQTGVSGLSDQFALAVLTYEWLAGRKPFDGDTWGVVFYQILNSHPPVPERGGRQFSDDVMEVLKRGMAKKPEDRYPTCGQFIDDLERALRGASPLSTSSSAPSTTGSSTGSSTGSTDLTRPVPVTAPATQQTPPVDRPEVPAPSPSPRSPLLSASKILSLKWISIATAAVLAIAAMVLWYTLHGSKLQSLAVLPFDDSGHEDLRYLSDGLTDNVINNLSRLPSLKIISRAAVYALKDKHAPPGQIGNTLGVDAILTGTVSQSGDSVHVAVELSDVHSNVRLWGEDYTTAVAAVATIPEDIAKGIGTLTHAAPGDQRLITKPYTANSEAYQLYLKGRFEWNKRTRDGISRAIDFYNDAIQKDPKFALAYAGLADCYALQGGLVPPREVFPKAEAAALRALDLDDGLAEAHTSLGIIKSQYDFDWLEAEHEFERAIKLNRNYATAHSQYARLLDAKQRFREAFAQLQEAQKLDPVSLGIGTGAGLAHYFARDYDQAIAQYKKTLGLEPNFAAARSDLAAVYLQQNRLPESIGEYEAAVHIQPNDAGTLCELGQAYAAAGRRDDALKTLDSVTQMTRQRYVSAPFIAYIYVGLNDKDKAFEMLNKGFDERAWPLMFLKVEPKYDAIRGDPRFADLLRRLAL